MQITFDLGLAFSDPADSRSDALVLREALEFLIAANVIHLRVHNAPSLYRSGVVYRRTKVWDNIPSLYSRGFGDCKSLSAALIAERRLQGEHAKPVFRWAERKTGGKLFHILVETENGYEDPSRILGMGEDELRYFQHS